MLEIYTNVICICENLKCINTNLFLGNPVLKNILVGKKCNNYIVNYSNMNFYNLLSVKITITMQILLKL